MLRTRIIPCLLLKNKGLVKGIQFKDHRYVGDPINAVQIFNSKEVDEILFLDITATKENRIPDLDLIQRISDQCLVPFAVGGGIKSLDDARKILSSGAEKVCINSEALVNLKLITDISNTFGKQSVVVSIDYKKNFFGKLEAFTNCGSKKVSSNIIELAKQIETAGAGEILLNSIEQDGTREGFDTKTIQLISEAVRIPVIASGGAGSIEHFKDAIKSGADAVSAGSFFVFHGKRQAVLISYLNDSDHENVSKLKHTN